MLRQYKFTAFCSALILLLSVLPAHTFPDTEIDFADLMVHFAMYGALATLLGLERIQWKWKRRISQQNLVVMVVLVALFGGLIEVIQAVGIETRNGQWEDALANALGAIFGISSLVLVQKIKNSRI